MKRIALPFAVALGLALPACGTTDSDTATSSPAAGAAATPIPVSPDAKLEMPGAGPVNVDVALDVTAIEGGDDALAEAYAQSAASAAETAIRRGGRLRIVAFGRVGARPLKVYENTLAPTSELGDAARGPSEQQWRIEIAAVLRVVTGLATRPHNVERALATLTARPGSGIGHLVKHELEQQPAGETPNVIVVITDALVDSANLKLRDYLDGQRNQEAAAALAEQMTVPSPPARVALLRIAPIGITAGREPLDDGQTATLKAIWELAGEKLPVDDVQVQT